MLALGACALALAAPALAARRPTAGERRAIVAALRRAHIKRTVVRVRISTVVAGWADADLRNGESAILHRRAGRWRVAQVGGLGVGCRIPYAVRRDFKLIC
jgi:hypothetical protein